jgi:hypothetical protein
MSTKKYKGTPLQMLLALRIVLENAILIAEKIKEVRPKWDEAFLRAHLKKVNGILFDEFGIDFTMSLQERSDIIGRVEVTARRLLQQIRVQIDLDFRTDYSKHAQLVQDLGFYKARSLETISQSQLLVILQIFSDNMTPEYQSMLVDAGMNPKLIEDACLLADECALLNVEIESIARIKNPLPYDRADLLVDLYESIMGITTIVEVLLPEVPETAALSYMQALYEVGYVDPVPRTRSTTTRRKRRRRY